MSDDDTEETSEKLEASFAGEGVEKLGGEQEEVQFKTVTKFRLDRFSQFSYDFEKEVYWPTALDLSKMMLTDIYPITVHSQLAYLRLSYNQLTNKDVECLGNLQNLVSLYLNHNKINSTTLPRLGRLQQLNLESNPIDQIDPIDQPNLQILILNNTRIKTLQYIGINSTPKLETLSATHCELINMIADYALTMKCIFLGYNHIRRIESLESLINLKILHLRDNKVSRLGGLTMGLDNLEYINLRQNEVTAAEELKKIKTLPSLRTIIITDNPLNDEMGSDIRPMVLMYSLELRRINKELTNQDEVEYARSLIYEVIGKEEHLFGQVQGEFDEGE